MQSSRRLSLVWDWCKAVMHTYVEGFSRDNSVLRVHVATSSPSWRSMRHYQYVKAADLRSDFLFNQFHVLRPRPIVQYYCHPEGA